MMCHLWQVVIKRRTHILDHMTRWLRVVLMLGHRLRRYPNIIMYFSPSWNKVIIIIIIIITIAPNTGFMYHVFSDGIIF